MIILEFYSDQQAERVNGGSKCRFGRFNKDFDSFFQAKLARLEGKLKAGLMQINRIIISNC